MTATTIVCGGRRVTDGLTAVGGTCGRSYHWSPTAWVVGHLRIDPLDPAAPAAYARAEGWAIGPNGEAICPDCRGHKSATT